MAAAVNVNRYFGRTITDRTTRQDKRNRELEDAVGYLVVAEYPVT